MSDPVNVHLPPLGLMRRFLLAKGWKVSPLRDGALDLFTLASDDASSKAEIVLPGNSAADDAPRRLMQGLRTFAALTGQDIERVAHDISMFDFDIVRARLPDSMVLRDSIPLRAAERFIGNARRLLGSAAAAELRRTIFVSDPLAVGGEYANKCRLGHTFRGSFGFTIESPAGPSPDVGDDEPTPAPFERRVVERIALGLSSLADAAQLDSIDPLVQNPERGFNVNMMDDFMRLFAESGASQISFDIALTPAWPATQGLKLATIVPQAVLPLLNSAIGKLRPSSVSDVETIVGKIITLSTRENPSDLLDEGAREIVVEGESATRGPIALKVKLVPKDYLDALDAHASGRLIKVVGLVRRSSHGNTMPQSEQFAVL